MLDDLITLGDQLIPGLREIQERERAAHLALNAIAQTIADKPWLLIYDDAESPAAIEMFTPSSSAHIIVTSRWPYWHDHAEALHVDSFPPDMAVEYLIGHTRHPDHDAAADLAKELGYLPLALNHARATCWRTNWTFGAYRKQLHKTIKKVPPNASYPASVYATFSLGIEKIAQTYPQAEFIMAISAFFAAERIPLDLFRFEFHVERDGVEIPVELDDVVAALADASLLIHETLDDGSRAVNVHCLVQTVVRERLGDKSGNFAEIALMLIRGALDLGPVREHTEWPRVQKLLSHAISVVENAPDTKLAKERTAAICHLLGLYFHSRCEYELAEIYAKHAVEIALNVFAADAPETAAALDGLGMIYLSKGRGIDAEPLSLQALTIREKAFGPSHPDVGITLNNLASIYHSLGQYSQAEQFYQRALEIAEKQLSPDDPYIGIRLDNLAQLYLTQGRYDEALPLLKRASQLCKETCGAEHPDFGIVLVILPVFIVP